MEAEIIVEKYEAYTDLILKGRFSSFGEEHQIDELKVTLDKLIEEGEKRILINCRRVEFISLDTLEIIAQSFKDLRALGGRIVPYNIPEHIRESLVIVGLNRILKLFDTFEEAFEYANDKVKD